MDHHMTNHAQLNLLSPRADTEAAAREWLVRHLRATPGWFLAADLCRAIGQPADEDGKRHIRRLASDCPQILSGQRGYCHLDHAAVDEITHAAAWLEHQAKTMGERAARLRRAGHARMN